MHTWNTIKAVNTNKLDQAIDILETLQQPRSARILKYLKEHERGALLDLALCLRMATEELEQQLELLCQSRVISRHDDVYGCYYTLNAVRLRYAGKVACGLAAFYRE